MRLCRINVWTTNFREVKMKTSASSNCHRKCVFAAVAAVIFIVAVNSPTAAQDMNQNYEVGDKVEIKRAEGWFKAVVTEIGSTGRFFTIVYDRDGYTGYAQRDVMRLIEGAKPSTKPRPAPDTNGQTPLTQSGTAKTAANKYKTGDRVECDRTGMEQWEKGTVVPLRKTDFQDGRIYRVLLDSYAKAGMYLDGHDCTVESMRLLAGAASFKYETTAIPVGKSTVDEDNTVSADRPIMACPVEQPKVKNGARPNIELFKKIIRCRKGEKSAARGLDGAVAIEVTSVQPGATRPWVYRQDIGGKPGTIIQLVKATFHYKTFYRSGVRLSQNWISTINFFVNSFGEWEIGSEDIVKMGDTVNVPRVQ